MGTDETPPLPGGLTPRQQKWFASVSLERDTGRSLAEWVAIARTCPETKPKARADWLREHHGLGVNRAAHILSEAFPPEHGWDDATHHRAQLWTRPEQVAILEAVEAAVAALPAVVHGQRKAFSAWSRNFQFAALKPLKPGGAALGLALPPDAARALELPRNEGWSERLKSKLRLASATDVDASVRTLLWEAWNAS